MNASDVARDGFMEEEKHEERREEYAYVLDFLLTGKSFSNRPEPVAQLMGDTWFTLLEAEPKPGVVLKTAEQVYIGRDERDKISIIKARITFDKLTETAKRELPGMVAMVIKNNEQRFVDVFNNAGPMSIRQHTLELLPNVGKKHLKAILTAREDKRFESFADIATRVPLLQDPVKLLSDRVVMELSGNERFYLFVKPYVKKLHY